MKRVMVTYRCKPDQVERNETLVRAVYDELQRAQTKGLRYATYKLDDGVTFVHIATIETDDGVSPLRALQTFAQFQEGVEERCEEPATSVGLSEIGLYRLVDEQFGSSIERR